MKEIAIEKMMSITLQLNYTPGRISNANFM